MNDREAILARVRSAVRHAVPHPGPHPPPPLARGWSAFAAQLEAVGGNAVGPLPMHALADAVASLAAARADGGRIVAERSAANWLGAGPWQTPGEDPAPHSFEDVAVAIVRGTLGVAENGAVAVVGRDAPHRALPFLAQHLILLLSDAVVVADLHSAFSALPRDALHDHHLTWISGPSKTADIEQTLVYGAHGPLTLDVVGVVRG